MLVQPESNFFLNEPLSVVDWGGGRKRQGALLSSAPHYYQAPLLAVHLLSLLA
jgi:hypothetical protein